ncbi:hypothetical protein T11_1633 [Trichinella zimbabwensis]|uniref:Uncharacterized protein n=1 Tax=Trichinella zimbabwensis TaxID=268475 RepID=A0A0V1I244_9BILA|nr:hypothetical protein T11_1633 [Trichinella zimbabwensis]
MSSFIAFEVNGKRLQNERREENEHIEHRMSRFLKKFSIQAILSFYLNAFLLHNFKIYVISNIKLRRMSSRCSTISIADNFFIDNKNEKIFQREDNQSNNDDI